MRAFDPGICHPEYNKVSFCHPGLEQNRVTCGKTTRPHQYNMLFNSFDFALFLPFVFVLYWFVFKNTLNLQNILLLFANYFFYACWDWRFLFLLAFSTGLDYCTGLRIAAAQEKRLKKVWLWTSILVNLGFLGCFKYYNFFAASFAALLGHAGFRVNPGVLDIILPVGISFYTFHGLSYVLDIYAGRIKPERRFSDYALFVSFFPLLVAGPIERATHLLPQIKRARFFDRAQAADGLRQMLWGLFKKVVIADNCAEYANLMFDHPADHSGSTLLLGVVFFAFQIYGDFSGYSDIALGTARLFGFELLRNFAFPYFSRDIAEFWRRWHISLSSWFRDYLYIPLGGNQGGPAKKIRNTLIVFLASGLWHGANWTFLVWGALNALYLLPLLIFNKTRQNPQTVAQGRLFPSAKEVFQMLFTFWLTLMAWVFFRAENLGHATGYISKIYSESLFTLPKFAGMTNGLITLALVVVFLLFEWAGRERAYAIEGLGRHWRRPFRWAFYFAVIFTIGMFMQTEETPFIYFQF
jgi:alginate O-acetyltransferase complex protein AlgI